MAAEVVEERFELVDRRRVPLIGDGAQLSEFSDGDLDRLDDLRRDVLRGDEVDVVTPGVLEA